MTKAQHTPGPWKCDQIGHEVYETARLTVIATLPMVRTMADDRLIAAASELLSALKELVLFKHFPESKNPGYAMALEIGRSAITKAEGELP